MTSRRASASPRRSASRRVSAISDSGIPNRRSIAWRYSVAPPSAARMACEATAAPHIGCSSRGGPGSTTMVGPPSSPGGTTRPGAVPTGSSTVAPAGIVACLRLPARMASRSRFGQRLISGARIWAMRSCSASSSTISRPWKRPTTSAVRSSAVGPRPPLVSTRSMPESDMNRSAASMSPGRSPTITVSARSTPRSRRRSASHGPLRSLTRPVSTSVPVTTMPARALMCRSAGVRPAASGDRPS